MIENVLGMAVSLAAGCAAGYFYFAGLWWTAQRLPISRFPVLLASGSFLVRMAVLVLGFIWAAGDGRWERVLFALAGVIAVRFFLVRRVQTGRKAELI